MEELLTTISSIASLIAVALFVIFRNSAQKYVDEKAKNLATLEDTAKITNEVEGVKSQYLRQSHAWKWVFEKEYEILKLVWDATWEFQASARSVRPMFDRVPENKDDRRKMYLERYEAYRKAAINFRDVVYKNQPFIPPDVYETCIELRGVVIEIQVQFEMSLENEEVRPDWKRMNECTKTLDTMIEELNTRIRSHIHGQIKE